MEHTNIYTSAILRETLHTNISRQVLRLLVVLRTIMRMRTRCPLHRRQSQFRGKDLHSPNAGELFWCAEGSRPTVAGIAIMSSSKDQVYVMTPETPLDLFKEKNVVYQLGALMPARESRVVEYKAGGGNYTTKILPAHINKYGSAFLNSSGGTLCIGVNDDGTVVGVYANYSGKERIRILVREQFSRFTPPVDKQYYTVEFVPCNKQDYYVIEIHVKPGDRNEIYSDGDDKMYIRRDGSVQGPLWPREIRDIATSKYFEELGGLESLGDSNKNPLASLSTGTPVLGRSNSKK